MHGRNFRKTRCGWFLSLESKNEKSTVFMSFVNFPNNDQDFPEDECRLTWEIFPKSI